MRPTSRVAINTLAQIVKSVISIVIVLWTSRVVLSNLGVQDYGIYTLVCGFIAVLGFLRISLSSTAQRYLSFYQKEDSDILKGIFNNSLVTQLIAGVVICGGLALFTTLIFSYLLNIPPDRMSSAKIVYWMMLGCLFLNLLSIPYVAALIARENIIYTSVIQVVEALLKIPIALSLYWIHIDKLEWYAMLMLLLNIIVFMGYMLYCVHYYNECRTFQLSRLNTTMFAEMFRFSGWDMYGNGCHYLRKQGVAVLLNNFFTVSINAAYGIGYQVASQIEFLSVSLMTATRPQIIKAESICEREKTIRLAEITSKFSFLLLSIIAVPLSFYIDVVLKLWLGEVPLFAEMFCLSFLCVTLVNVATSSLNVVNQATGHVKAFNVKVNTIRLAVLPIIFVSLKFGANPSMVMILYFISELCCSLARVLFLKYDIGYPVKQYWSNVATPCMLPLIVNIAFCFFMREIAPLWGIFLAIIGSIFLTSIVTLLWSTKEDEKAIINFLLLRLNSFCR